MNRITYNSLNGKFFYEMQESELLECMQIIKTQIAAYSKSTSCICISDQERQSELWRALQNINFNLNELTKGENDGCYFS